MNRRAVAHVLAACATLVAGSLPTAALRAQAAAAPRGQALYDLMGREALAAMEGEERMRWLPDGSGWYVADSAGGGITFQRVDARTGRRTPLFDQHTIEALRSEYERISGESSGTALPFRDFSYVGHDLVFSANGRSYRFDLRTDTLALVPRPRGISAREVEGLMPTTDSSQLVLGSASPDLSHVAYVRGYDLYMNDAAGMEIQLTTGGSEELMNGRPDWVYAQALGQRDGFRWSPDGTRIAYLQWDEHTVQRHPILHELTTPAGLELQRYPAAGTRVPTVRLFVVDLRSGRTREIDTRAGSPPEGDQYIVKLVWLRGGTLAFQRLNRDQNVLELLLADVETGSVRTLVREEESTFVSLHDDLRFIGGGRRFVWSSERSGWRHLYLYDDQGKLLRQLTSGDWPVQRLVGVDERNGWVYFTAARADGLDSHLFKVRLDGSHLTQLTTDPGVHRVELDPTMTLFTDTWSSMSAAPRTDLRATADGRLVRTLDTTNTAHLEALGLERPESLTVTASDGMTALHGVLFRPAGFDSTRRYPLVVSVHGGPHAQCVTNSFQTASPEARLAQLGFVVWKMDNRGTRNRGKAFEAATYLKLGQVDLDDQAAAVRQLARRRTFVDSTRVGIYGRSYGGYLTIMALLEQPGIFQAGVAESSVTDWRNYDAPYTERYMRTPGENPDGYAHGSALAYAPQLRGHLLIAYGTSDNDVHEANSLQLIDALERTGKAVDVVPFPEQRHGPDRASAERMAELRGMYFVRYLKP